MPRTPERLAGPVAVADSAATIFTATGDHLIRHVHVQNPGLNATFTMSIGSDAGDTRVFDGQQVTHAAPLSAWVYWFVADGEIVQVFSDTDEVLVVTIGGDALA